MGAKRKLSDVERQAQRLRVIRNRTYKALREEIGIDVDLLVADDKAALAQAERNIAKLRQVGNRMRLGQAPTAPTAERRAHAPRSPREVEVNPATARAHRFDWSLETICDRLSSAQFEAAERLRNSYLLAQPRSAVADTTGAGGASDPSKRLAITEAAELASRDLRWVMDRIPTRVLHKAIKNFVLEEPITTEPDRCLTFEEYGMRVSKYARDRGRAIAIRDIQHACDFLMHLWHARDAWHREQCHRTDRMVRSPIGQRAGRQGWICALWDWVHRNGRLPSTQADADECRARHDAEAHRLRMAPPMELERFHRRRDKLTAMVFRDDEAGRVRIAG